MGSRCRNSTLCKISAVICIRGFQFTCIPFCKYIMQFLSSQAQALVQNVINFSDHLHVAILDAIMHHLDIVTGPQRSDILNARLAILCFGGDRPKMGNRLPGFTMSSRHYRWAPTMLPLLHRTPVPMQLTPLLQAHGYAVRYPENELPPSIRISPGSRYGFKCAITLSTGGPAGTNIRIGGATPGSPLTQTANLTP